MKQSMDKYCFVFAFEMFHIVFRADCECYRVGTEEWHVLDGGSGGVQTQNGKLCKVAQS